jgi:hypothetical protein
MGFPFTSYNSFSERHDFLYLKKSVREEMTRCWGLFQVAKGDDHSSGAGLKRGAEAEPADETPAKKVQMGGSAPGSAEKESNPQDNGRRNKNGKAEPGKDPKEPKEKEAKDKDHMKKMQKALVDAAKMKQKHASVTKLAETLIKNFAEDPSWNWAQSPNSRSKFDKIYKEVSDAEDCFDKQFLTHDIVVLKKNHEARGVAERVHCLRQ